MITSSLNRPDTLDYYTQAGDNIAVPVNSLENRRSAHYLEINRLYQRMMLEEVQRKYKELAVERPGSVPAKLKQALDKVEAKIDKLKKEGKIQ